MGSKIPFVEVDPSLASPLSSLSKICTTWFLISSIEARLAPLELVSSKETSKYSLSILSLAMFVLLSTCKTVTLALRPCRVIKPVGGDPPAELALMVSFGGTAGSGGTGGNGDINPFL